MQDLPRLLYTAAFELLIPLVFTLALVVFLWGSFMYFMMSHDEEAKEKGKSLIMYGLIVFLVMVLLHGAFSLIAGAIG